MYKGEVDEISAPPDTVYPGHASGHPKRELLFKILVIGELGTGKTSFIKRYVHQVLTSLTIKPVAAHSSAFNRFSKIIILNFY
jgi:GTPase SAR1 family protein